MTARLLARGVERRFGATIALAGVDLEVRSAEIHALLGENGAGKSTLMKVLSGAIPMDRGSLTLDGDEYAPRDPADARRQGVAMIYQELALAPHLNVAENVLLGIEPRRLGLLDRRRRDRIASLALAKVGRAELPLHLRVGRLSTADRQLVEIARSVAFGARVLVLDEPTSSLGEADTEHLFALCRALREEGCSIIYISHFLDEIRRLADRVTVMRDGRTIATHEIGAIDDASLIADMVGRAVEHVHERAARVPGEVLLRVEGSGGDSGPLGALLEVRRGEVVGIAGLVGSGRTEFLRALMGLDARGHGSVSFRDRPAPHTPRECWRAGIGMVSEDRKLEGLARSLSIAENVALPRLPPRPTTRRLRDVARAHVTALDTRCRSLDQSVGDLSGGNQQKVAIARLSHCEAELFLLDEPTRGIDVAARAAIYRWIDAMCSPAGDRPARGVLIVSSQLPELFALCDRIAVMCRGRLGPALPVAELDERSVMRAAIGAPA